MSQAPSAPAVTLKCRVETVYGSAALPLGAVASASPLKEAVARAREVRAVTGRMTGQRGPQRAGYAAVTAGMKSRARWVKRQLPIAEEAWRVGSSPAVTS